MINPPPICQISWEFDKLLDIFKVRQPKNILEIGMDKGGSLYQWALNAPSGATIVGVDQYVSYSDEATKNDYGQDKIIVAIGGDSRATETIVQVERYAPFNWIFIDGSHRLDDVIQDWHNYGGMVARRGIVAFHDIAIHTRPGMESDVPILWDRIKRAGYRTEEFIAVPYQGWGGIGVIRF